MKKLLTILSSLIISTSSAALVIACNNTEKPAQDKPTNQTKPINPTNPKTPDSKSKDESNESTKPQNTTPKKPNDKQPSPSNATSKWNSIFSDSPTGDDINLNPSSEAIEKENMRLETVAKEKIKKLKNVI
ncbi:MAG6090-like repeat-containing lipoprotein [Mycoplasma capricolum]|uniref:MAG6090-like repeat-containing lipoprotein n=1 Tax=Mycoplasma capricolum TaxID=2095 RepID=UPI001A9E9A29|nr:lipoprotein [Mycoplasma capricolum]